MFVLVTIEGCPMKAINLSKVDVIDMEYSEGGYNRVRIDGDTVFESKDVSESEKYFAGLVKSVPTINEGYIMAMAEEND